MIVPVKNILDTLLKPDSDWKLQLFSQWPVIIGSLRTQVRLEKIVDDMLIIGVYESHWLQELFLLSRLIIATINKQLGHAYIKQLRFKLIEPDRVSERKEKVSSVLKKNSRTMELKELEALKALKDDQLGAALQGYYARCFQ